MRVISGKARGCKLIAPEGLSTRPTGDRIKESLFNILAPDLYDCSFLDIFSGTGAIAIEALSRGAANAVLIDNNPASCEAIRVNLNRTRLSESAQLLAMDCIAGLNHLKNRRFDIIFMDPPYYRELVPETLKLITDLKLLAEGGYVVIECGSREGVAEAYGGLELFKTKEYKTTSILFLQERTK